MKQITLNKYDDPCHGWVKVRKGLLRVLGIEDKISGYSYVRKDHAYLEEDCDFDVLCTALETRGFSIKVNHHHTNRQSKIRGYARYSIG